MDSFTSDRRSVRTNIPSSSHQKYNYDNLPKFSRNNHINGSISAANTSVSDISMPYLNNKERFPFSGSRRQMMNESYGTRNPSENSNSTRLPSGLYKPQYDVKKRQTATSLQENDSFFRKISDSFSRNVGGIDQDGNISNENVWDAFINFIKSIISLLWILVCKGSYWVLYGSTKVMSCCQRMSQKIPNPDWKTLKKTQKQQSEILVNENENSIIESTVDDIKPKYPGIARRLEELNHLRTDEKPAEKEKTDSDPKQVLKKDEEFHYGTRFYPTENKSNAINLESTFLNIANSITRSHKPYIQKNDNIETIRSSIQAASTLERPSNIFSRPTFTRSTARFADLEWLKDDNEDYINNLEYTRLFKEYQRIFEERNKMQELLKIKKLKDEGFSIKSLNKEKTEEIETVWYNVPSGVLISKFGIEITIKDLLTLSDGKWLNDNVIDFYLKMVANDVNGPNCVPGKQKIHVFSTHFYSTLSKRGYQGVARWAKRAKVDVSKLQYLFVPVNLNQMHWTLALVDNVNRRFMYVDSLYGTGDDILMNIMDYMTQETEKMHGKEMNGMDYTLYDMEIEAQGPKQQNGFDCGVFTCTAVSTLARNRGFCYSQNDMSLLRRKMAYEILKGQLES